MYQNLTYFFQLADFPFLFGMCRLLRHDQEVQAMPQDKDKTILIPEDKALSQMHKAAAKDWEERYGILEKLLERVSEAARVLTAERTARLYWLYGLGDLARRILEDARLEIGGIIDAAYEQWQTECDERRQSRESTDAGSESSD